MTSRRPRRERQAQFGGNAVQPLVVRPKLCFRGQSNPGEQVHINIANAPPGQTVQADELHDFYIRGDACSGQIRHGIQHGLALAQIAQSQFADDKGMCQNQPSIE